ncbi:furin-like protease 2 isoform X4 [Vespula maculifrons]|uniref:Furin-like protease 2 isoform X4 n=1 Tax=Vespula maculifrons TaxID=7453 RepID=A0ABD2ARP7_VESMC
MIVRVTLVCFLLVGAPIKSEAEARPRARPVPIYSNQFAVHVPEGVEAATEIAEKHGFDNHGQIHISMNIK